MNNRLEMFNKESIEIIKLVINKKKYKKLSITNLKLFYEEID